ncbi:MAG: hypothetical protein LPH20_15340, partial [Shewanella sp.]|nr:hypothetical protein [Shewanella sp.]
MASRTVINCEQTWIVGKLTTPTVDFYFRSRQANFDGYQEVDVNTLLSDPSHPFWSAKQNKVILIRDVPIELLKRLVKLHEQRHIVWFTDDDIPGAHRDASLPKLYKKRLAGWYRKAKPILANICSEVWVSTRALAETYGLPDTAVLPPLQLPAAALATVRCFYHGSGSHTLEWAFVIKLIALIQQKYSYTWFELIGDHTLYRQVRHIPRVTVLHPMSWPNYQAHIGSRPMDIGLAPLFDSPFNK